MGVRAYKIEQVNDEPTFSCSHDEKLMEFLEDYADVGDDLIAIGAETIREIIAKADELELTDEQVARFKADVSEHGDDDEIIYLCR